MRKLMWLAVLVPFMAQAIEFPKWDLIGDYACFNFEKAKQLRVAQNECLYLQLEYGKLEEGVAAYEQLSKLQNEVILKLQDSNKTLSDLLAKMEDDRDKAEVQAAVAKGRSITGGGFPWVIAGVALSFAGGIYLGYRLAN